MLHQGRLQVSILRSVLTEREDHQQVRLLEDGKRREVVLRRLGHEPAEDGMAPVLERRTDPLLKAFVGTVPPGVWTKQGLTVLDLSENGFENADPIPAVTWNVIQTIDLSDNVFEGELPASIWTRTTLLSLDLAGNQFTGGIPTTVNQLAGITALDLSDNEMGQIFPASEVIPDQITALGAASISLHGNECFTASMATAAYLETKDANWDDGCALPTP